ncbi:MAG: FeoB-associated Cys-rich membrane protein, partial [Thermodesulfobacteriota bacterium]
MDGQTLLVVVIVAAAAWYVGRSLWPTRAAQGGCHSCPHNRN